VIPSWSSLAIGFFGPLEIAFLAKFIDLAERPMAAAVHFLTGALLAFVALTHRTLRIHHLRAVDPSQISRRGRGLLVNRSRSTPLKPDSVSLPHPAAPRTHNYN